MLRWILTLTLLTGALAGAVPTQAQEADTITIGFTDLPTSLDPADTNDFAAWEVLSHLYTGLARQVPGTLEYELALATDWTVSEDKLTHTFTLDETAAFSDGTPITAQTFVESITRVQTIGRDGAEAVTPYIASVTASDDTTLIFTLKRPVPYFLGLVSLPPYFPQHPDLSAQEQVTPFMENGLIGNGPYLLALYDVGTEIRLEANPAYSPAPATPNIVLRQFSKSANLRNALAAHEIDVAWRALYLGHLEDLTELDGLQVIEQPSTRVFYMVMGQNREPTDDPLVRDAVITLLDRDDAVEVSLRNHVTLLTSLLPELYPEAYYPVWPNRSNVELAESVLSEAGYSERGRFRLNITISFARPVYGDPYTAAIGELGQSSFSFTDFIEYGIFSDIEASTFRRMLEDGDSQAIIFGWTPIVPHPDAYLYPLAHSDNPIPSRNRYNQAVIDQLIDKAAALDDAAKQGEIYMEVADWLLEDDAVAPLWQDHLSLVAWNDIAGIQVEPNYFLHYDQLVRQ